MIVGRDAELARLRELVGAASDGRGGAVAVVGTAGVGKSCLVDEVAPDAAVRLYGVQAERDLPYAAVSALVTPLLSHLHDLPDPQRARPSTRSWAASGSEPGTSRRCCCWERAIRAARFRTSDQPWLALAAAMADPDDGSAAAAIEARLGGLHHPFVKARYLLAAGERLRRTGDRRVARQRLRAAADLFHGLSNHQWLARTEAELRASGATLRRQAEGERLTPSEHRVATLVAEGRTNKEVAALLIPQPQDGRLPPGPGIPEARRRQPHRPGQGPPGPTRLIGLTTHR